MAKEILLPPRAASLTASMRDMGYSLQAAVADIVDNSISAGADCVDILCICEIDNPFLSVLDNGSGMDREQLIAAMRHGATDPRSDRKSSDLGRFGLGMKTASFSQCRKLTVISSKNGVLSGAEWDLDLIDTRDDWIVSELNAREISDAVGDHPLGANGTLVLWRNLDRLLEGEVGERRSETVNAKVNEMENHLSLVFHRFLAGEYNSKLPLKISVNGHSVESFDPFFRNHSATQILPAEVVRVGGSEVRMQPYILPHYSKISQDQYRRYQTRSNFFLNQGVYVYRNGRLMTWGDWFRLISKGESTKLARVQIDFSNDIDELWTIDIKKSRARPPNQVRDRLGQIINRISDRSTSVHRGRGKKLFDAQQVTFWDREQDRDGINYRVNRSHPLIEQLIGALNGEQLRLFEMVLRAVSSSFPVAAMYSDYSVSPHDLRFADEEGEGNDIGERLSQIKEIIPESEGNPKAWFRNIVSSVGLFNNHMEIVERYIENEF